MSTYDCSHKGHQHSFSIPYETYFLILNSSTLKCPGMERIFHIYILTIMESLVYASLFLKRTYNLTNDWEHLPSSSICISIYEEFIFESCDVIDGRKNELPPSRICSPNPLWESTIVILSNTRPLNSNQLALPSLIAEDFVRIQQSVAVKL
jgi:hypothetical protein